MINWCYNGSTMFIRDKKNKKSGKSYLQIVENKWVEGKTKQEVVLSLGCLQTLKQSGQLRRLAKSLIKYCEGDFVETEDIEEKERVYWGIPKIVDKLWLRYDLDGILQRCLAKRSVKFDFCQVIKLMLADRFQCPCSKLKSYEGQDKYAFYKSVDLHQLYRSLDYLAQFKEKIEKMLFEKNIDLFNMKVDVVFYDVTTMYFESEKVDALRNFGFSKDHRVGEVQVVIGLLIDQEGRPIGFDVFAGNTYEGHTLKDAITKLKVRFAIDKLIIVSDRGMLSKANIEFIKDKGYEYIISARLRTLSKVLQKQILDLETYQTIPRQQDYRDLPFYEEIPDPREPRQEEACKQPRYKVFTPENVFEEVLGALHNAQSPKSVYRAISKITKNVPDTRFKQILRDFRKQPFTSENRQKLVKQIEDYLKQRLIVTWYNKRAKRDKAKRDVLIAKAQQLIDAPKETISQRGPRRYVKPVGSEQYALHTDKIRQDAQWDGFYGIYTNNLDLRWQVIRQHYHTLWKIEESFRIFKSHLETRPMFHWTEQRIRGHLVLCFIAFLFERTIELELKQQAIDFSPSKIRDAINSMQASVVEIRNQKFYLMANSRNALAKRILKCFNIKAPTKIVPAEMFKF